MVEGPAGSGKTRLVHDAVDVATIAGLDVATASCDSEQPGEALHAIRSCLGMATAPQGAVLDARLSVVDDACTVIEKRAQRAPLVVLVDDLQWADPTSMLLLGQLVVRLSAYPVLWLFAACFGETQTSLGRVLAALGTFGEGHRDRAPSTVHSGRRPAGCRCHRRHARFGAALLGHRNGWLSGCRARTR